MFKLIGTLFVIGVWIVAIILFLAGIVICIENIKSDSGWRKCLAVLSIFLGVVAFIWTYDWADGSILWCLIISGLALGLLQCGFVKGADTTEQETKTPRYGFADALVDAYVEEKVIEEAVTNAIRKSKE